MEESTGGDLALSQRSEVEGDPLPRGQNQMIDFGPRLKRVRQAVGLKQEELAAKCGIPRPRLSEYENSKREPMPDNLKRLAQGLGVSSDVLLGLAPEPPPRLGGATPDR